MTWYDPTSARRRLARRGHGRRRGHERAPCRVAGIHRPLQAWRRSHGQKRNSSRGDNRGDTRGDSRGDSRRGDWRRRRRRIPNTSSKLSNFRSIHLFGSMVSLSQLDKFMTEALKVKKQRDCYNIGSLKGQIVTSVNLQPNTKSTTNSTTNSTITPSFGKRKCHNYENDSRGRAREAVDAARHR